MQTITNIPSVINDSEIDGRVASAVSSTQQSEFQLLLAMMHQNIMERPRYAESDSHYQAQPQAILSSLDVYPKTPLQATETDFELAPQLAQYVQQQDMTSVRLMHCLSPTAMALKDDWRNIPAEVIANAGPHVQESGLAASTTEKLTSPDAIEVHEPLLADLLTQLNTSATLSAVGAGNSIS